MPETLDYKKTEIKREFLRNYLREQSPLDYFVPIDHPKLQQQDFLNSPKKNKAALGGNRSSSRTRRATSGRRPERRWPGPFQEKL